ARGAQKCSTGAESAPEGRKQVVAQQDAGLRRPGGVARPHDDGVLARCDRDHLAAVADRCERLRRVADPPVVAVAHLGIVGRDMWRRRHLDPGARDELPPAELTAAAEELAEERELS